MKVGAKYSKSKDLVHKVVVPHEGGWIYGTDQRFVWCAEHCESDYRGAMFKRSETVWHFKSQTDAILFALRWL